MLRSALFLTTILFSLLTWAQNWEVIVLFSGADMTADYQGDIDRNILELARADVGPGLRLKIIREFKNRYVSFEPDRISTTKRWDSLFFDAPMKGLPVQGRWNTGPLKTSLLQEPAVLQQEFQSFFSTSSESYRMLVIYGHGEGARGLKGISTLDLQANLNISISDRLAAPKLDILWLDSCFMANIEVAFQLRHLSRFYVSSEEAEFSAGMPFDTLDALIGKSPLPAAQHLALRFVESYSFFKKGSQSSAVEKSSATISVISNEKLEGLVAALSEDARQLQPSENTTHWPRRLQKIEMERSELVDLGGLLTFLPSKAALLMETASKREQRTTPRVLISNVNDGNRVVFGFENWRRGQKGDEAVLSNLPERLAPKGFVNYKGKLFPYRLINKKLILNPYVLGVREFNWAVLNSKDQVVAGPFSSTREKDISFRYPDRGDNPLEFVATTHSIGSTSEKYSGLNVSRPFTGLPFMDYLDLEFNLRTKWIQ